MTDERLGAWAYLSRVAEPPCPQLRALARRVGPIEAAERVRRGAVDSTIAERTESRRELNCASEDLDVLSRLGGRVVTEDDDEWPTLAFVAFKGVGDAKRPKAHQPMVLWMVGPARLDAIAERAAAIVGTRAATAYGEHVAADFAAGLAGRDAAVVSGGAFGIDAAAHRAALAVDGCTVAVLAGGVDVRYPSAHTALLRQISESGLIVSEYPPGVRPARHRFLTRNRLVAGLSRATVVVEAGARSGAANTAAWARTLGRPVCAVPGPVTSSVSVGCHALLRDGETNLVTRAEDVIEVWGHIGALAPGEPRPISVLDELSDTEKQVYEALPARGARSVDEIAVASGLPPTGILGALAMLEVAGLVVHHQGRWKLSRRV
jgi:DNA processing protein